MTDLLAKISSGSDPRLLVLPVGGCGEFGLNLTVYRYGSTSFVVDAGLMFAEDAKLGVDALIPDVEGIFQRFAPIRAYLITHGHEDHIGALPHLVSKYPAPIYTTPWAARLIASRFERHGILDDHPITVVQPFDVVGVQSFSVEWLPVSHSIPMCCALHIRSPAGTVLHTGDFKIDGLGTPEGSTDMARWKLPDAGVDVVVCDSTNADRPGHCPPEQVAKDALQTLIEKTPGRIFFTTFSSNLWRLQAILEVAKQEQIPVVLAGAGIRGTTGLAADFGLLDMSQYHVIEEENPRLSKLDRVIFLVTGSQAEPRSSLARIARGEHKYIKIEEGDTVVFSSRIIPGSERRIFHMIAELQRLGAKIITTRQAPDIHVSGHAYSADVLELIKHAKPNAFLAVHGTYTQLLANATTASVGGPSQCLTAENGIMYALQDQRLDAVHQFPVERLYVDGESGLPMSHTVLRDRLRIGENGLAAIFGVADRSGRLIDTTVTLDLFGLPLPHDYDEKTFRQEIVAVACAAAKRYALRGDEEETCAEEVRIAVRRFLATFYVKKPVVLVRISGTDG